jgi:membrane-associated phospholipid phosphatase
MASDIKKVPSTSKIHLIRLWLTYQRPVFLVCLVTGLAVFLVSMPGATRLALFRALLAQRFLLSMLFLFALILVSLVWSTGQRLDAWVFLFFNLRGYHNKLLDAAMWVTTQLGSLLAAFILAGVLFWTNHQRLAAEIIFGVFTLWLFVEITKILTDRARPFLTLEGSRVIGWREIGRSFPSGHTSQTFFLVTLLNLHFQPGMRWTVVLYAVAVLVGFTRIYVGVHYPRDVLGGAMLGSLWGVLANLIDPYWIGFGFFS